MEWFCTDMAAEGDVQILVTFDISKERRTATVKDAQFWDIRGLPHAEWANVKRPKISRSEAMQLNPFFVTEFEAMAHTRASYVAEDIG